MEQAASPTTAYEETFDPTTTTTHEDGDEGDAVASYLVPRLAAYAVASSHVSSASHTAPPSENEDEQDEEAFTTEDAHTLRNTPPQLEERVRRTSRARESGERSAAHGTDDTAAQEDSRGLPTDASHWGNEEEAEEEENVVRRSGDTAAPAPIATSDDAFVSAYPADDDSGEDEEDGEPQSDGDVTDDNHRAGGQHRSGGSFHYASAFAHSRVKELLKYEGSSSIISKDAAAAACEAVALLTRDLVAMAAAEATRRNRKTLTYDDVARVAQLLDRFSFLSDVVPPVPASSGSGLGAGRSIVVSNPAPVSAVRSGAAPRSKSAQGRGTGRGSAASGGGEGGGAAARAKTAHTHHVHPAPGPGVHSLPGGMRQATLRF